MSYFVITKNSELTDVCNKLSSEAVIAVDTEFKRETSYFPIPCLMQISTDRYTVCIDLLTIKDLTPLKDLLFNKNIIKIFHAARQDLELFYFMFNEVPSPIFDTQIAASFLGFDNQIGYANLVSRELNVSLDKSQTRTDWTRRPITKKQLDYAANDVIYLYRLYHKQLEQLTTSNRLHWCEQDFQRLTDISLYKPCADSAWKKVKNYHRLSTKQKCIVYKLATWRELEAIEKNKTRNAVLKNATMIDLAYKVPNKVEDLESISELNNRIISSHGAKLISLVKSATQMNRNDCPSPKEFSKLTEEESNLLSSFLQSIEAKSQSNNIDSKVICSKKELEKIVRGKRDSILFSDWRYEFVGKEILDQLPN